MKTCSYCLIEVEDRSIQIDHIVPVSKGGLNDSENLTYACAKCNRKKSDKELNVFLKESNIKSFKKTDEALQVSPWNKHWLDNEFNTHIRITEDDLNWLKKTKGRLSIARWLHQIINEERYGKT